MSQMAKRKYVFGDAYWVKTLANKHLDTIWGRFADEALPNRRKKVILAAKRVTVADLIAIETFQTKWLKELDMEEEFGLTREEVNSRGEY